MKMIEKGFSLLVVCALAGVLLCLAPDRGVQADEGAGPVEEAPSAAISKTKSASEAVVKDMPAPVSAPSEAGKAEEPGKEILQVQPAKVPVQADKALNESEKTVTPVKRESVEPPTLAPVAKPVAAPESRPAVPMKKASPVVKSEEAPSSQEVQPAVVTEPESEKASAPIAPREEKPAKVMVKTPNQPVADKKAPKIVPAKDEEAEKSKEVKELENKENNSGEAPESVTADDEAVEEQRPEAPAIQYGIRLKRPHDPNGESLLGNYLAGQVARGMRDHDAAARYFARALKIDPGSDILLEQTFVLQLARGNWAGSTALARELVEEGRKQRFSHMVLGLQAVLDKDYARAQDLYSKAELRSPLDKMIAILVDSWLYQAKGQNQKALDSLDQLTIMNWARYYQDYHMAMIADLAGRHTLARRTYKKLFAKDPRSLRLMEAYVRHLAATGAGKKALSLLAKHIKRNGAHPLAVDLQQRLKQGEKLALIASTPQEGLAELYYGIGDALTGDGGVDLGMIYLQAGLKLRPALPLASMALAEAYEESKHYEQANRIYDQIGKESPLWPGATVRKAFNLNSLDRVDEAKESLDELIAAYPNDITAVEAQGNILRAHKRFKEAVYYYSKAISLLPAAEPFHWKYYYSRGVCYERLKDWPNAEKDLLQAHKLDPDRALVLNYLGYSWVDQGLHLKRAMRFIRRAVELKPDDGYFVDSLGWAHFRLHHYKKAVQELERAVEIKPDDPVINDHLGDAYWRVGRRLEARFQWSQSLTLEPEKADAIKIRAKLKHGLPNPPRQPVLAVGPGGPGGLAKMKRAAKNNVTRVHVVRSGESLWTISKHYYGKGQFHQRLLRANRRRLHKGNKIRPGLRLVIPPLR